MESFYRPSSGSPWMGDGEHTPSTLGTFVITCLAGVAIGWTLALLNRPYYLGAILLFSASYLGQDLYRLLVFPGVRFVELAFRHSDGRMHFISWLLYTMLDLSFVGGVVTGGVLMPFRGRTSNSSESQLDLLG